MNALATEHAQYEKLCMAVEVQLSPVALWSCRVVGTRVLEQLNDHLSYHELKSDSRGQDLIMVKWEDILQI